MTLGAVHQPPGAGGVAAALVSPLATIGVREQYVDPDMGDDDNDGRSWGLAKKTLEAAIAALPGGPAGGGGVIRALPGSYTPAGTLHFNGHSLIFESIGSTWNNNYGIIRHTFNGDLINFESGGGVLENFILDNRAAGLTGTAINAVMGDTSVDPNKQLGKIFFRNGVITSGNGNPWERNVNLDGSAGNYPQPVGIRTVFFDKIDFFGCTGPAGFAGENIRLTQVVHCYFSDCEVIEAPAAVTQLVRIVNGPTTTFASCEDIGWHGGAILGGLYSEAAGARQMFAVPISGDVTLAAGSKGHYITPEIGGVLSDLGDQSNFAASPFIDATALLQNAWANFGGGRPSARYRKTAPRTVALSGFLSRVGGPVAGETILGPLPLAYRPTVPIRVVTEANGALTVLEVTAAGNVTWVSGGSVSLTLDGVTYPLD